MAGSIALAVSVAIVALICGVVLQQAAFKAGEEAGDAVAVAELAALFSAAASLHLPPLPASAAFDGAFNALAAASGGRCLRADIAHALHDILHAGGMGAGDSKRQRQRLLHRLAPCDEIFGGAASEEETSRLIVFVQALWTGVMLWLGCLIGERGGGAPAAVLDELLTQQRELLALGEDATEMARSADVEGSTQARKKLAAHEQQWLSRSARPLAATVRTIFQAQVLGAAQAMWLSSLQPSVLNATSGPLSAYLVQRFGGRPFPIHIHRSANLSMGLFQSIWINGKNMADQSAEVEEEVIKAADSGNFLDIMKNAAVDEGWIFQLQTLLSGVPWIPDVPLLNAMYPEGMGHGELAGMFSKIAAAFKGAEAADQGRPANGFWGSDPLASPFTLIERGVEGGWEARPMSEDAFIGPVLRNASGLLEGAPGGDDSVPGAGRRAQAEALRAGDAARLCASERDLARRVLHADGRRAGGAPHLWVSLCPVAGDWRDGWKSPLSLTAGAAEAIASSLPRSWLPFARESQAWWHRSLRRMGWSPGRAAVAWPASADLGEASLPPIIGLWPEATAGALQAALQEPHLVQFWSPEHGPFGPGGTSAIMMDAAKFKCKGAWTAGARVLGAPLKSLPWTACACGLVGGVVLGEVGPPADLPVGYASQAFQQGLGDGGVGPPSPSELWTRLQLSALKFDPSEPRPRALGSFGSWWPAVRLLLADTGALLGCRRAQCSGTQDFHDNGTSNATQDADSCCWSIIGRLASELRPWEDFMGSDTSPLLAATVQVAWLADAEVLVCEEFEVEDTGEITCECAANFDHLQDSASQLLELLMDIVLAGDPMNLQKTFAQLIPSDGFQVVYSCALQGLGTRRYLAMDRGDIELPAEAAERLAKSSGVALPLGELLGTAAAADTEGMRVSA